LSVPQGGNGGPRAKIRTRSFSTLWREVVKVTTPKEEESTRRG